MTSATTVRQPSNRMLLAEMIIVLALSLGQSAVYAIISLLRLLAAGPLKGQSTALNTSQDRSAWFDLLYQLLGIAFTLVPVVLVLYLLTVTAGSLRTARHDLGLDLTRPLRDLVHGLVLLACIGIPGLAFYYLGRALGITVDVIPAALAAHWWTVPVLILQAVKNAVLEEVVVAGYLIQRLERLGVRPWLTVAISAVIRGSYHLYQGVGPGIANLAMGVVFGEYYRRTRRTMPLIIVHTLLDVFAFVGYALLKDVLPL
jgi:membrane protease YdiL (CAAX protease family)